MLAKDKWYIVYHRKATWGKPAANHRVTCIEELHFDAKGYILPVKLSFTGVQQQTLQ
jgi:hypothetical protein